MQPTRLYMHFKIPNVKMLSIVLPLPMFLVVVFSIKHYLITTNARRCWGYQYLCIIHAFSKNPQCHYDEFHFTECHNTLANISYIYGFWFFIKHQLMAIGLGGVGAISIFAAYMCILSMLYLWLHVADRTRGRGYCSHPTPPSPPIGRSCKALPWEIKVVGTVLS